MVTPTFDFDAQYTDALIDDAARTFVHRLFGKYLWVLVSASIVNIVGFVVVVILGDPNDWQIVAIGFIAALGPVYFPLRYVRMPKQFGASMKKVLVPSARVSITPTIFTLSAKDRSFTTRWTELKAIEEYPDYFMFVVGLLAFTFVPRRGMPKEMETIIREVAQSLTRPNSSMQSTGEKRPAAD